MLGRLRQLSLLSFFLLSNQVNYAKTFLLFPYNRWQLLVTHLGYPSLKLRQGFVAPVIKSV